MPSRFYARYVPPVISSLNSDGENDSRPRKKKKIKETDTKAGYLDHSIRLNQGLPDTEISKPANSPKRNKKHGALLASASAVDKQLKSEQQTHRDPKKLKTTHDGSNTSVASALDEDAATTVEDKHRSIRAKFQEVTRISQQALHSEIENGRDSEVDQLERIQSTGLQPLPQPKRIKDEPHESISALPKWLANPVIASETASFSDLNISSDTVQQLSQAGFSHAFAIQAAVLSRIIPGPRQHQGDICISALTGSGKTLAYTLPIIEALKDKPVTRLRALIIVPTRELVLQVQEVFRVTGSSLKVGIAVGSKSLKEERDMLIDMEEVYDSEAYQRMYMRLSEADSGIEFMDSSDQDDDNDDRIPARNHVFQRYSKIDVLICTPGRLVDHIISTKGFTLEHLQWLIVDEADRLLDQSFQEWIDVLMPKLEKPVKHSDSLSLRWRRLTLQNQRPLRKIILSATMTQDYSKLVALNLQNPILVTFKGTDQDLPDDAMLGGQNPNVVPMSVPENLSEIAIAVKDATNKPLYLAQLIQDALQIPASKAEFDRVSTAGLMNSTIDDETRSSAGSSNSGNTTDSSSDAYSEILSDASSIGDGLQDHKDTTMNSPPADTPMPNMDLSTPEMETSSAYDETPSYGMLVFTNTNENALRLCRLLVLLKPSWTSRISPLTKSVGTSSGRKALAAFRKKKIDILVATDLASRGLDLSNLAYVVNYDLPKSATTYIHRVGRTARAGRAGIASTLVAHHEAKWFWNEIGRSSGIRRSHKVKRQEVLLQLTEDEQEAYESALERLGQEAKGNIQAS